MTEDSEVWLQVQTNMANTLIPITAPSRCIVADQPTVPDAGGSDYVTGLHQALLVI